MSDETQHSLDATKVASALREAIWAMVSEIHLAAPGADYRARADEYLQRTESAQARYAEMHGTFVRWRLLADALLRAKN